MKVKLMAITTGAALVIIVGAIATMYSQHAFGIKSTTLILSAFPHKGKVGSNTGTLPVTLFGVLTSESLAVPGASITLTGTGEGIKHFTTDQLGSYSTLTHLGPGTHTIVARYAGDSEHGSSSATKVIPVTP